MMLQNCQNHPVLGDITTVPGNDFFIVFVRLLIFLWMVLPSGQGHYLKRGTNCMEELRCQLRTIVRRYRRQNTKV